MKILRPCISTSTIALIVSFAQSATSLFAKDTRVAFQNIRLLSLIALHDRYSITGSGDIFNFLNANAVITPTAWSATSMALSFVTGNQHSGMVTPAVATHGIDH